MLASARGHFHAGALRSQSIDLRRYATYALPVYVAQLIAMLGGIEAAKIIVSRQFSIETVAQFGFCAMVTMTVQRYLPTVLLMGLLRPLFATVMHSENPRQRLDFLFSVVVKLNIFVLVPMIGVAFADGNDLISLASSGKILDRSGILASLLVYVAIQSIRTANNLVMVSIEDGVRTLFSLGTGTAAFLVCALSMEMGGTTGLIAILIGSDLISISIMRQRIRRSGQTVQFPLTAIGKLVASGIIGTVAAIGAYGMISSQWMLHPFAGPIIVGCIYLTCAWALKPFTANERNAINRLLPVPLFVW
ncbi:MAG: hypothetical protein IPK20_21065 [Betaproteobacteria bacterium]|nr:hypothetical protein [Betaproteobacteria bacterium]